MSTGSDPEALRTLTDDLCARLQRGDAALLAQAKELAHALCRARQYEPLCALAEAVARRDNDPTIRRLYGQALIERGLVTAAIDVLGVLAGRLAHDHPEFVEATGLLGRCHKQIFFDADDKTNPEVLENLTTAIRIYRAPYEESPDNFWHGVNLIALMRRAQDAGLEIAAAFDIPEAATRLIQALEAVPEAERDAWHAPTLAEAHLALGDWDQVEAVIARYAGDPHAAFQIASTLRQFHEIWDVERMDPQRGSALLSVLRARLVELDNGALELSPADLAVERERLDEADVPTFEALLGSTGTSLYQWWKTGLGRAEAVASIREKGGERYGTGFLVRACDLGLEGDEAVVLTNFHVVNEKGLRGLPPADVEVSFEAASDPAPRDVAGILWESSTDLHDAAVLRLAIPIDDVAPLPVSDQLPDADSRVYIIGHPGGRELAFSFQDNALLDHEGPTEGRPKVAGVVRLHYRAPTEGGSSGSPVFNARRWEVIALHHAGHHQAMGRLNGKEGIYGANEGIWISSIRDAILASRAASCA